MTISAHALEAWAGTTRVPVIDAALTMDESWSPYVQGSITAPLSASILDTLDPRGGARLALYASQSYGVSDKLTALTSTFGGGTIAGVTAIWGGTGTIERTNLAANPSLETNITGYTGSAGTVTRVTTDSYIGAACLMVTGVNLGGAYYTINGVPPNVRYWSSFYVKGTPGDTVRVDLRERTAANVTVGTTSSSLLTLTGIWQRISISRLFGATGVNVQILLRNGSATSSPTYWDAQLFENSTLLGTYFDGTLTAILDASYAWTNPALPHASTSVQKSIKRIAKISEWYFAPYNTNQANKLSTFSTLYSTLTIAALTAAWTAKQLYNISEKYARSYPDGINRNFTRGFNLNIRSRSIDLDAGTIKLTLASDEALLQDYALVSVNNFAPVTLQLRALIKDVLARIGGYLADGVTDHTLTPDAAIWPPGQTAWDYLTPLLQEAALKLYCDENRLWHLVEDTFTQPGLVELWGVETITGLDDVVDRDAGLWYDAVVIKYSWLDELGVTIVAYDTAQVDGFSKVRLIEYETVFPGAGAAQRILNRALARGRELQLTAVSNYAVQPSTLTSIYVTGYDYGPLFTKSVSWNYPGDTMTITTRNPLEEG